MFTLLPLPYAEDALAPYISQETIEYHYGKHHQGYVNKLNQLIEDTEFEKQTLEEIIQTASGALFNNAAQVWNHHFYWQCLSPNGKQQPSSALLAEINKMFDSLAEFKRMFQEKALSNFGSGWTWLVKNTRGTLEIINTSNAENPLTSGYKPLLTCDVWEHAYYIDYRNERAKYLESFWSIINWNTVSRLYEE